ncbi:MAG: hypothetical protein ABEJ87_03795 [Candidatus Nanohalobium sp.]
MSDSTVTFLSLIGTLTFGMTTYLNYMFYRRLEDDKKTTIEMFLLKSEIEKALKILLVSILVFGFSGLVSIIGSRVGSPFLAGAIVLGLATFFIAYMIFFITLYLSTQPHKDFPYLREEKVQEGKGLRDEEKDFEDIDTGDQDEKGAEDDK